MTINERMSLPIWKKIILYFISLIIFLLQFTFILSGIILGFNVSNSETFIAFRYAHYVFLAIGFCFVLYIMAKPILVSYKLTWTILILLFPLPFCFLYVLNSFSRRTTGRKRKELIEESRYIKDPGCIVELEQKDHIAANIVRTVQKSTYAPVYDNCDVKFFTDIYDKFEDIVDEVIKAKKYIFMDFFIVAPGYLMDTLYPILLDKGRRGVEIKILYDSIGSGRVVNHKFLKKLSMIPNCMISNYEPIGMNVNFTINNRNHRKIFIIDGEVCYCGGDNLADEYINKKNKFGHWRDNCAKYKGPIVNTFLFLFYQDWKTSTKTQIDIDKYKAPDVVYDNNIYAMAFGDGPLYFGNPAYDLFQSMISNAKKSLYISTPYFIINDGMLSLIALKIKEGLDVKILMPGIPDKKTAYYMGRANYRQILAAGGKIYEYTPGFNHAKNIIVDDKYLFTGTVNMDYRSLFLHYECGGLIINEKIAKEAKEDFDDAVSKSRLVTYEDWKKRPWYQKLLAFFLNILAPMF